MSDRAQNLIAIVKDFRRVHNEWSAEVNRPDPDQRYNEGIEAVIQGFAAGDIPSECRAVQEAVADLTDEWDAFVDGAKKHPATSFFASVERLFKLLEAAEYPELKPLETLKQLRKEGVSDRQICDLYGFYDKRGRQMDWLIDAELDKPGSVLATPNAIDGRTWEDPRITERKAKTRAADHRVDELRERKAIKAKVTETPCPESPRDLWRQNVPIKQSAAMLLQSEAEVKAQREHFEYENKLVRAFNQNKTAAAAAKDLGIDPAEVTAAFETFELLQSDGQELVLEMSTAKA